jgi:hypothetical protein
MLPTETEPFSAAIKHETPELPELIDKTDALFLQPNFSMTEPDVLWKDKISEVEKANMKDRVSTVLFDMRVQQAKDLGFVEVTDSDITHDLMGTNHNNFSTGTENNLKYEWSYNHHTDEVEENRHSVARFYKLIAKVTPWWMPPFRAKEQWTVAAGPASCLKTKIPHDMVARMNRLKKLKLFNCFMAFAPTAAFNQIDPQPTILIARISEFRWVDKKEGYNMSGSDAGHQAYFFVGHWK